MTRALLAALVAFAAAPTLADVERALTQHLLPSFANFAQAAHALADAARADCRAAQVQPAFHAAFDAWIGLGDLHVGPSETEGLSIAFWPDDRGFTPRALTALVAAEDPIGRDPVAYADVSIAARGFYALEMLLHDPAFSAYGPQDYTCALIQTIAADLDRQAQALSEGWATEFAPALITAGAAGNTVFLSKDEALRALYTQLVTGLDFTADARLGRPMGTFDRPRPRQAEAWRSQRSLRNVTLASEAALALAHGLSEADLRQSDLAAAQVRRAANAIIDQAFQDVQDPQARLRIEVLQQAVRALRAAIAMEVGDAMGIAAGFNAQDGD